MSDEHPITRAARAGEKKVYGSTPASKAPETLFVVRNNLGYVELSIPNPHGEHGSVTGTWHSSYIRADRAIPEELVERVRMWALDGDWALTHCETSIRVLLRDLLTHLEGQK